MNKDLQVVDEGILSYIKFSGHYGYTAIINQVFREECRKAIGELDEGGDEFFEIFTSFPDFRTEEPQSVFRVVFPSSKELMIKDLLRKFCEMYRISFSLEV